MGVLASPSTERSIGRVVVVEEFPETGHLLGAFSEEVGFETVRAKNTPELMRVLGRDRPDLMLLDVGLTDHATVKLIQFLRATYPEVAVVAVADDRQAALLSVKAGARVALSKPLEPAKVKRVLRSELGADVR